MHTSDSASLAKFGDHIIAAGDIAILKHPIATFTILKYPLLGYKS
jgi:hypothetical protein